MSFVSSNKDEIIIRSSDLHDKFTTSVTDLQPVLLENPIRPGL